MAFSKKMRLLNVVIFVVVLRLCSPPPPVSAKLPKAPAETMQRWRDMRFGLFIHWGPVSLKGTEIGWSRGRQVPVDEYDQLYRNFNPTAFNADEWVEIAKFAGMRYLVITSKHHDGFCIWDSQYTDYDIMATPFKRDILKELSAACKKQGVVFCTYHSICDWYHPDYATGSPGGKTMKPNPNMDRYVQYLHNQTREIIENYGPIGTMWFDGEWEAPWTHEHGLALDRHIRSLQPDIIVNNRVDKGRRGMHGSTAPGEFAGDYDTPEQRVGTFNRSRPWETCMTLCRQWAWKPDDQMKPLQECLQTLLRVVGGDGNLLFNVGPMPDGRIEPRQVERLKEMGAWLKQYGEGVYATRGGPFQPGRWGASTCKGNRIYLFLMNWPDDGPLVLPPIDQRITKSQTLTRGDSKVVQSADGIRITVPASDRDDIATVVVLETDGRAFDIPPVRFNLSGSVTVGQKATASNVYQNNYRYSAGMAVDDDPETRWATDAGTKSGWLEVDLGQPATFDRVQISECVEHGQRIQKFSLQYKKDGEWTTCLDGTTIGRDYHRSFAPVSARFVRLQILQASDGPTISEFQLFAPKRVPTE